MTGMKVTQRGVSFNLEGLTLKELRLIWRGLKNKETFFKKEDEILSEQIVKRLEGNYEVIG